VKAQLIRFGGMAAIVAGVLRVIASFIPSNSYRIMLLYLITDVLLFLGSIGLYGFQQKKIGVAGTLGFLLQIGAILVLIGRDVGVFGANLYPVGALMFAAGLDLFAIGTWQVKMLPSWILSLWILSTVIGPIGYFASGLSVLFVVSGILFGIGFASAGFAISMHHYES
jgi:hypothetical protein